MARERLEANEAALQARIADRTKELSEANDSLQQINKKLSRSNSYLEEFAYAASHDLKERIRKIQVFISHLKAKLEQRLSEEEQRLLGHIQNASARMGL